MGASDWAAKIFSWIAHAFISLLISLITLAGTLIAAYSDFRSGMIIFWFGCLLAAAHQLYRMRGMLNCVDARVKKGRVYAGSLFSVAMNVIFGYGGAYIIYEWGMSARTSSPFMAALFPERAPFVFALTAAAYATLQIFLAIVRAVLAFRAGSPPAAVVTNSTTLKLRGWFV